MRRLIPAVGLLLLMLAVQAVVFSDASTLLKSITVCVAIGGANLAGFVEAMKWMESRK